MKRVMIYYREEHETGWSDYGSLDDAREAIKDYCPDGPTSYPEGFGPTFPVGERVRGPEGFMTIRRFVGGWTDGTCDVEIYEVEA